jgi:hypothetical protein
MAQAPQPQQQQQPRAALAEEIARVPDEGTKAAAAAPDGAVEDVEEDEPDELVAAEARQRQRSKAILKAIRQTGMVTSIRPSMRMMTRDSSARRPKHLVGGSR